MSLLLPTPAPVEPLQLSRESFERFAQLITRQLGIKMSPNKIPMLQSRLQRRLRVLGLQRLEQYQRILFDSPQAETELADFMDAVTTNKTDFFREPHHFEHLTRTVLPERDPDPERPWQFKLWCAGCSTGEEPYTLAMVLREYAGTRPGPFTFSILATDISTRVLHDAREAIYDEDRIAPVPEAFRHKYLLRSRNPEQRLVRIAPALRACVEFQRLNFMDADYHIADGFDCIFFRNVMIYFDKPTQQQVVSRLCRNLLPGGRLFIGHSESLIGLDVPLRMVASAVYERTPTRG